MIGDEARPVFSAGDAAMLVLGVLFHDCALHLSEAGFDELIHGSSKSNSIPGFDRTSWEEEWERFYFAARRWDDMKLKQIIGADSDGQPIANVRDPFKNLDDLRDSDRRIVGEFLRIHHARFAHEAAVFGVPGNKGKAFELSRALSPDQRDVVGVIARSHN
jgi:molecular chaperone HtpG